MSQWKRINTMIPRARVGRLQLFGLRENVVGLVSTIRPSVHVQDVKNAQDLETAILTIEKGPVHGMTRVQVSQALIVMIKDHHLMENISHRVTEKEVCLGMVSHVTGVVRTTLMTEIAITVCALGREIVRALATRLAGHPPLCARGLPR